MVKKRNALDEYHPQQTHRIVARAREMKLSVEEYGVHRYLIDLMWIAGGPVRNNARSLAADLNMTVRAWNRTVASLQALGLLIVTDDSLSDIATMDSIRANSSFHAERSESGKRGGEAAARNRVAQAEIDAQHQHRVHRENICDTSEENSQFAAQRSANLNETPVAQLPPQLSPEPVPIENSSIYSDGESVSPAVAPPIAPRQGRWLSPEAQQALEEKRAARPAPPEQPMLRTFSPIAGGKAEPASDLHEAEQQPRRTA